MKRVLAILLSLTMLLGAMPAMAAAPDQNGELCAAEEIPGASRLAQDASAQKPPAYASGDQVTVIVQLESPALLDYCGATLFSVDRLPGAAVSDFLASEEAAALSEEMAEEQNLVLNAIQAMLPPQIMLQSNGMDEYAPSSASLELVAQWTAVMNGMSIRVPYGLLPQIQALDGVKRAYVEHTYRHPEPVSIGQAQDSLYGYSLDMTNLEPVWNAGYTGKGMTVAVLDSGLDMTYAGGTITRCHEAFTENSFRSELEDSDLRFTETGLRLLLSGMDLNAAGTTDDLYKNRKVPFAYDYADGDFNVQPVSSDHGTHVSGTIAGYAKTADGGVKFSGVAPDAQILVMKVFPDVTESANETVIINALEDAMKLGADVVNLSLGSDNGYASEEDAERDIHLALQNAGVLLMTAAGNSSTSSTGSNLGDSNPVTNPDNAIVSSPSTYSSDLSVAAINNAVNTRSVLVWTGSDGVAHTIGFNDPTSINLKKLFASDSSPKRIFPVGGYGSYWDFSDAGFEYKWNEYWEQVPKQTGIALVQRGELSFAEKQENAAYAPGVQALIVYDSDPNGTELISMQLSEDYDLPAVFISGQDGAALAAALEQGEVTMTVQQQDEMIPGAQAGQMADFSSWGPAPGLELKPEITAPGGNIYSTIMDKLYGAPYTGAYGMLSGTSMATPHMAGISAQVEQYVRTGLGLKDTAASAALTRSLLVSTAVPQKDADGVYFSPRQQGAGLVNAGAAITTPAYLSVVGQTVGKLELKDDPSWTGSYELNFRVENISGNPLTYDAQVVLMSPAAENGYISTHDAVIGTWNLDRVQVPTAGAAVGATVSLSSDQIQNLKAQFPNGTYVEGFVILTDPNGVNPQIGLPILAFLGDWTTAPILDSAKWIDTLEDGVSVWNNSCTWGVSYMSSAWKMEEEGYLLNTFMLGMNPFDDAALTDQGVFHPENISFSPNGDNVMDKLNDLTLYQLRSAKLMVEEVRNADTGELYYRDHSLQNFRTVSSTAGIIPSTQYYFTQGWDGTDLNGAPVPHGTRCTYTVTAYGEGEYDDDFASYIPGEKEPTFNGHPMDKTGDVFSFDVTVDTEAPKLENNAVRVYEENGRTYITGTFYEDTALASIEVLPLVYFDYPFNPEWSHMDVDVELPFYVENIYDAAARTRTFTADVTEYLRTPTYELNPQWTGIVYVYGGDYAGNDRGYAVVVDSTEGLTLSQTSALMYPGESLILSVNNNTDSDQPVERTSSDPSVATIDEFGNVVAVAPGQTVITVSNGKTSAVCVIAVEPLPPVASDVTDFKLSIDHFDDLTPGGQFEVRIEDLQPYDVYLTQDDLLQGNVYVDVGEEFKDLVYCEIGEDGRTILVGLESNLTNDSYLGTTFPKEGSTGTLHVIIGGVERTMTFNWKDLYDTAQDQDIIAYPTRSDQTVYVNCGETATLIARYNNKAGHEFNRVALYTAKDYPEDDGDRAYSTEPAEGLILDGPPTVEKYGTWTGKLVNLEGYALPDSIRVFERGIASDGSYLEYEKYEGPYDYTYDPDTGDIMLKGMWNTNLTLVVRADGVPAEGTPAGTLSGSTYEMPDGVYGPFTWTITGGNPGTLTTAENVRIEYDTVSAAYFTPSQPGVTYITAAGKDGMTLTYVVVAEPVLPSELTLDTQEVTIQVGETRSVPATLTPIPTLAEDAELIWTSFSPDVAAANPDGSITGLSEGYAYFKVTSAADPEVWSYCVVHVVPAQIQPAETFTVTFNSMGGSLVASQTVAAGTPAAQPQAPVLAGYIFSGWFTGPSYREAYDFSTPVTADLTLFAQWTAVPIAPVLPPVIPIQPTDPDPVPPAKDTFADVPFGHWAHDAVEYVAAEGIFTGISADHFDPNGGMTRAMMVTVLWRLEGKPDAAYTGRFDDVASGVWYTPAVEWASAEGVVKGVSETSFAPNDPVTREQIAVLLWRLSGSPAVSGNLLAYPDGSQVSGYAETAMIWATQKGLFSGDQNGLLHPLSTASRAEVATLVQRYIKLTASV